MMHHTKIISFHYGFKWLAAKRKPLGPATKSPYMLDQSPNQLVRPFVRNYYKNKNYKQNQKSHFNNLAHPSDCQILK